MLLAATLRAAGQRALHLLVWQLGDGNVVLAKSRLDLSDEHIGLLLHNLIVAEVTDGVEEVCILLRLNFVEDGQVLR